MTSSKIFKAVVTVFVLLVVGAASAYFLTIRSVEERPPRVYRVGVVSYGGQHTEAIEGLKEGMRTLGYEEGRHISYLERNAEGSLEKVKTVAQEFIQENVDAVYSITTPISIELQKIIAGIPVVFNVVSDPVGSGIAKSMLSSGNNFTGCSNYVGQSGGKRVELTRMLLPKAKTVLILYDPTNKFAQGAIVVVRDAAKIFGFTIVEKFVKSKDEIASTLESLKPGAYDVFFHLGEAKVTGAADKVIAEIIRLSMPSVAHEESFVDKGMLVSYGPSWRVLGRQCAIIMDKVLKGTNPADISIQIPDKFELVINLKTAESLGITIPENVLTTADRIIR